MGRLRRRSVLEAGGEPPVPRVPTAVQVRPASCADPAVHGHSPASGPWTAYSDPGASGSCASTLPVPGPNLASGRRVLSRFSHADGPTAYQMC